MKKSILLVLIAVLLFGCHKNSSNSSNSAATPTPPPPPAATFSCTINGVPFTATSISAQGNSSGLQIEAAYSSATIYQNVNISIYQSYSTGTYALGSVSGSSNDGIYNTGPNSTSFTEYYTTTAPPANGTCVITTNSNNVVSGTFSFICTNPSNPPNITIANGSFTNVTF